MLTSETVDRSSTTNSSSATVASSISALISLRDVVKTFETAAGSFQALRGVGLAIDPGEFVAITGRSGSGKSTLLNMFTGIDRPTSGEITVASSDLHRLTENQLAIWRGRNLGIVFQFFQLLPTLTVLDNVILPMDFAGSIPGRQRTDRAMDLLGMVDLAEHAHKLPAGLSGGQQQRAAIARALANDPPLLVADEPTGNLDTSTAESVFALFERLIAGGKTIVMVTHDDDLANRASRQVVLRDGQIVDDATGTGRFHV
jgi:putative ABC transport system ATP-binding protein